MIETIKINEVEYVRKDQANQQAEKLDGLDYCMIRTIGAGVFAGYIKRRDGKEADLVNARRIYYWSGAATLSQLATEGTKKPNDCKFCIPISVTVLDIVEIIKITDQAKKSIDGVALWKM